MATGAMTLSSLAVVTIWPVWRWVWSATWMSAPPMLVGELFAADGAGHVEIGVGQGADAGGGVREGLLDFGDEVGKSFALVVLGADLLGFEQRELFGGELVAFGVGEDAIHGTRDVAQMEGDGGKPSGKEWISRSLRPSVQPRISSRASSRA